MVSTVFANVSEHASTTTEFLINSTSNSVHDSRNSTGTYYNASENNSIAADDDALGVKMPLNTSHLTNALGGASDVMTTTAPDVENNASDIGTESSSDSGNESLASLVTTISDSPTSANSSINLARTVEGIEMLYSEASVENMTFNDTEESSQINESSSSDAVDPAHFEPSMLKLPVLQKSTSDAPTVSTSLTSLALSTSASSVTPTTAKPDAGSGSLLVEVGNETAAFNDTNFGTEAKAARYEVVLVLASAMADPNTWMALVQISLAASLALPESSVRVVSWLLHGSASSIPARTLLDESDRSDPKRSQKDVDDKYVVLRIVLDVLLPCSNLAQCIPPAMDTGAFSMELQSQTATVSPSLAFRSASCRVTAIVSVSSSLFLQADVSPTIGTTTPALQSNTSLNSTSKPSLNGTSLGAAIDKESNGTQAKDGEEGVVREDNATPAFHALAVLLLVALVAFCFAAQWFRLRWNSHKEKRCKGHDEWHGAGVPKKEDKLWVAASFEEGLRPCFMEGLKDQHQPETTVCMLEIRDEKQVVTLGDVEIESGVGRSTRSGTESKSDDQSSGSGSCSGIQTIAAIAGSEASSGTDNNSEQILLQLKHVQQSVDADASLSLRKESRQGENGDDWDTYVRGDDWDNYAMDNKLRTQWQGIQDLAKQAVDKGHLGSDSQQYDTLAAQLKGAQFFGRVRRGEHNRRTATPEEQAEEVRPSCQSLTCCAVKCER